MGLLRQGHTQKTQKALAAGAHHKEVEQAIGCCRLQDLQDQRKHDGMPHSCVEPPDPPQPPEHLQGRDAAWSEGPVVGMQNPWQASSVLFLR